MKWKMMAMLCCSIFSSIVSGMVNKESNDGYFTYIPKTSYDYDLDMKVNGLKLKYESLKVSDNGTELHRVRRELQESIPDSQFQDAIEGGNALVKIMTIVKDVYVEMFQSTIDSLQKKIDEISKSIADLEKEEEEKLPKALEKLLKVQTDFVIAKQKLMNLASTTIKRVNALLISFDGITPGARRIDKRLRAFLRDFELLLERSTSLLEDALIGYEDMNDRLSEITAVLIWFKSSINNRLALKKAEMNNYIHGSRSGVYGGCAASILLGPAIFICYAIGAPILESKISQYKSEVSQLEKLSNWTSVEISMLYHNSTNQYEYIIEELKQVVNWQTKVHENQDYFEELFENKEIDDNDILDFLEITRGGRGGLDTGKEQTFEMLCGLANTCKAYLQRDHFIKQISLLDIPDVTEICTKLQCDFNVKEQHEEPKTIGELRITDFRVIASLGGGLSAGTTDGPCYFENNKYISHITGSSPGVSKHSSLFNIMSQYNKKLRAGSTVSFEDVDSIEEGNGLNFATFGATLLDADSQYNMLLEALKYREMPVNWDFGWKLITLDFGLDSLFLDSGVVYAHMQLYKELLEKLKNTLPNTVVLILLPMHPLELHPSNPLVDASLLRNASNSCKDELSKNAKLLKSFLEITAEALRSENFGVEIIPSMKELGYLIGDEFPNEDVQSKMGKFVWNNFVSEKKRRTKDSDTIKCIKPNKALPLTLTGTKNQFDVKEEYFSNMGIEIEIKGKTTEEVKLRFLNENKEDFKTKDLNENGCFGEGTGCQVIKEELKKRTVKIGYKDFFDSREDFLVLWNSKELSFKVECTDSSVIFGRITIKLKKKFSYFGDVKNKEEFKKLVIQKFYACSTA